MPSFSLSMAAKDQAQEGPRACTVSTWQLTSVPAPTDLQSLRSTAIFYNSVCPSKSWTETQVSSLKCVKDKDNGAMYPCVSSAHACTHTHMCTHTYSDMHVYTQAHTHTFTFTHSHIHTYTHAHSHTNTHSHAHTSYTYTVTCTHKHTNSWWVGTHSLHIWNSGGGGVLMQERQPRSWG